MMTSRVARRLAVLSALSVLAGGCGPEAPKFDKAAQYTPETVAEELLFRYRTVKPVRTSSRKPKGIDAATVRKRDEAAVARKSQAATKRALARTLDDLLEETGEKLSLVGGMSKADACKRVAEIVSKDGTLKESDKTMINEGLEELASAP